MVLTIIFEKITIHKTRNTTTHNIRQCFLSQDWSETGHQWVDARVLTATTYLEKQIKTGPLRRFFSINGRFDIENLRLEMTKTITEKKMEASL